MSKSRERILAERAYDVLSHPNFECVVELIERDLEDANQRLLTCTKVEELFRAQGEVKSLTHVLKLKDEVLDYLQQEEVDSALQGGPEFPD